MSLQAGQMLAHYRLTRPVGEGGMGVVWAAQDTKLDREVAVKVLPEAFAEDEQRLARFDREAKLLATLNHPNVASIYGFDHVGGIHFLVLELVPGSTLAEMIEAGPIPLEEALDICRQVAEGLEAAHAAGVIHRDLKPGNVKVTPDGKVKVLDFGLAKGLEGVGPAGSDLSMSPTVTIGATEAGVVLGTAPYMSPEQARGKPLDARTDIWSFGCVLYECLTGRLLFTGETVTDVLSAILQVDPDWTVLPANTPTRIRELLARCLERSPRNRLHHIADARIEIERALATREWTTSGIAAAAPAEAAASRTPAPGWRIWASLLAGLLLGVAVTWVAMPGETPPPPVRKFRLTTEGRSPRLPEISPDGGKIAYLESDRIWVRDLGEIEAREVPGTEGVSMFAWSPDGEWMAISRGGKLWKIPATGGGASLLCDLPETLNPSNAAGIAWGAEGRVAYNLGSEGVMAVPEQGGPAVALAEPTGEELDFHHVRALPGGRGYLFVVHRPEAMDLVAAITDEGRKDVLEIPGQTLAGAVYSPTGHLIFRRRPDNAGLWAVRFSLEKLAAVGEPFPLMPSAGLPSVANDGTLVHLRAAPQRRTRLVRVDRQGRVTAAIGEPQLGQTDPALSPDGSLVAVAAQEADNDDIWIFDVESGTKRRLTFAEAGESAPVWMPSGEEVTFSRRGGKVGEVEIIAASADGSGRSRSLARGFGGRFSVDGRSMIYAAPDAQLDYDIWFRTLDDDGEPVQLLETDGQFDVGFSPDGNYVVFASTDTGRSEVYITRFPSGEGRWQVSADGGVQPRWSPAGDRIFYLAGTALMEVPVSGATSPSLGAPRTLFQWESAPRGYDVTADGRGFLMIEETDPGALGPQVVIVQNWTAEFRPPG
ncbi:MAG: protein kinase [Acidobacteriota bacterium]|jgi:Tol biopolymer transport system component